MPAGYKARPEQPITDPLSKVFILLRSAGACAGLSAREFWRPDLVSAAARRAAMQPRDFVAFKCRILSRPRVIGAENALTRRAPMTAAAATAVSTSSDNTLSRGVSAAACEKSSIRIKSWTPRSIAQLKELAPYAVLELVLPGGSLMAILLWL